MYVDKEHPTYHPDAIVSEDGRYILIIVAQGCDNLNNVYLVDLEAEGYEIKEDSKLIAIADDFSGQHS